MIYLALTVILIAVASAQECRPPPYRQDMRVIYGLGFVEFSCPNHGGSHRLTCVNGQWQGYVPESCDYNRPTAQPPTRRPTTAAPTRPPISNSNCGPPPHRVDMLYYEGPGGNFIDYYCKPPEGGYFQPFAYRIMCRSGSWRGELPQECPQGVHHYPRSV